MMKIGLITITKGTNYGNRLQNLAMQMALEKITNYKVETLVRSEDVAFNSIRFKMKNKLNLGCSEYEKRYYKFRQFTEKYINQGKTISQKNVEDYYDIFVCGSDQVWNVNFTMIDDTMFLAFVKNKKKVAVSASFGVDKLPCKNESHIKKLLENFDSISVREESGNKIINDLLGKDVQVLCDPTFMLGAEEWGKIEKEPKDIGTEKYIFCYFLGNYSEQYINNIYSFAEKNGQKVHILQNEHASQRYSTLNDFSRDPSEFIWMLHHAEKIITDSFHAVVFSLIFNKKFKVINRDDNHEKNDMVYTDVIRIK